MSTEEKAFLYELKKWLIGTLFGIIVVSVGFYFTTLNRLSNLEKGQAELQDQKAEKAVIETELRSINKSIDKIDAKLDRLNNGKN